MLCQEKNICKAWARRSNANMSTLKSLPRRVVDMEIVPKKLPLALA